MDVFCAGAGEADWDDGVEAEDLSDESCDIWYFFFGEAFFPRVSVGVDFHDLSVGSPLDLLTMW